MLPAERVLRPFKEFARVEASGSILLLLAATAALVWANSPWRGAYFGLWQTELRIGLGGLTFAKPLLAWINDGLMALFFFIVGLEIKRELLVGALASRRRAALPIAAALGGMLFPAGIYSLLNAGGAGASGWGIPMATDIAFALGVLALLGERVPASLKVFLAALAIADDIGAVVVIALFYTREIAWPPLAIALLFLGLLVGANRAGARHPLVYAALGFGLWLALLNSGVHATIAGVLVAMTIPARARINTDEFLIRSRAILEELERVGAGGGDHGQARAARAKSKTGGAGRHTQVLTNREYSAALVKLAAACEQVEPPLHRLERALHPWVTFAILPLFALANAGLTLEGRMIAALAHPVGLGVLAGLVVGKPLGITLFAWLAVRVGLAALPQGVSWRQILGVGWLGGIGFTMALFIAGLAFGEPAADALPLLAVAKLAILCGSLLAGAVGWLILRRGG